MGYYDNYLEHKLGGWSKKNHKYTSRYKDKKGKWRYVYGNLKNSVRRKIEDASDKIGDTFDTDYDHILDLFDKDVRTNLVSKLTVENGFHYEKFNRQFERKLQRGEYNMKDWKFINDKDEKAQSERKQEDQRKQEEKQQKKAEKAQFFQGNHFKDLPRQKNPSGKTYGYYKKISTGNGKYRYFYSEAEYSRYMKRTNTLDKDYSFMQDVPVLAHKDSAANAAKVADVGTDLGNCSSCSVAFELRMRGYDVKARDDVNGKSSPEIMMMFEGLGGNKLDSDEDYDNANKNLTQNAWYVDTTKEENEEYYRHKGLFGKVTTEEERLQMAQDDLERTIIERGGENQRGFMNINWTKGDADENGKRNPAGGGHIFNYVVTNGEVKFYDAQKDDMNNQIGGEIDIKDYLDNTDYLYAKSSSRNDGYITYNHFYRVDNLPLTEAGKANIQYEPVEVHDTPRTKEDLDKR